MSERNAADTAREAATLARDAASMGYEAASEHAGRSYDATREFALKVKSGVASWQRDLSRKGNQRPPPLLVKLWPNR
jgi:hypothetical protein